jgi:hypothetical protein
LQPRAVAGCEDDGPAILVRTHLLVSDFDLEGRRPRIEGEDDLDDAGVGATSR